MTRRSAALVTLLVLPLFCFMSAEEGHGGSGATDFIGKAVNFLILFGGLTFLLRRPLAEMLRKRSVDIQDGLAEAKRRREEAETKYSDAAARLAGLETEIQEMRKKAEEEASTVKDKIARLAATETGKIRRFAEQEIEEYVRGGLLELKSYAADRAADLAGERIRKRLGDRDHGSLIDKSIGRLARIHERSGSGQ